MNADQHRIRLATAERDPHIVQPNADRIAPDHAFMKNFDLCALDETDLKQATLQFALSQGRGEMGRRGGSNLHHNAPQAFSAMA